jgi:hypothetical protein
MVQRAQIAVDMRNAAIGFIPFNQAGMFKPNIGIAASVAKPPK